MSSKDKRSLIILLDVFIGVAVEIWASGMAPEHNTLIVCIFSVLLIIRIWFDYKIETVEERFYDLHIKIDLMKMETTLENQTAIKDQMKRALANGDLETYKKYSKIQKDS